MKTSLKIVIKYKNTVLVNCVILIIALITQSCGESNSDSLNINYKTELNNNIQPEHNLDNNDKINKNQENTSDKKNKFENIINNSIENIINNNIMNNNSNNSENMINTDNIQNNSDNNIENNVEINSENNQEESLKNNNSYLSEILLSENLKLSPAFNKNITQYHSIANYNISSIKIILSAENPASNIIINENPILTDGYSEDIYLSEDDTDIKIEVIAENNESRIYSIIVRKDISPRIIIHFEKPDDWNLPWIWFDNNSDGTWETQQAGLENSPGEMINYRDNWYKKEFISSESVTFLFNNGSWNLKVDNKGLDFITNKNIWIKKDGYYYDYDPVLYSFPNKKFKAVVMSYDDGNVQDRKIVEIFNNHGIRGTFHINSGKLDDETHLNKNEIQTLFSRHEVSAHTYSHPYLSNLSPAEITYEIETDRQILYELTGYEIRGMSYPFGDYNDTVLSLLPNLGIEYSRIVPSTYGFKLPSNYLLWEGTCHHTDALNLAEEFINLSSKEMALFFIWGHSWELDGNNENNNWDHMENLCEKIGNKEDFWYATAIEIVDYLKGLAGLKISNTENVIYNPLSFSVWINTEDTEIFELKPNHTIFF